MTSKESPYEAKRNGGSVNKEYFIKEHPSLKRKMAYFLDEWFVDMETIHETQIDKQKVKEAIDKFEKGIEINAPSDATIIIPIKELKKELEAH